MEYQLTVTNGFGLSSSETIRVVVIGTILPPTVAVTVPSQVLEGSAVNGA